jgi:hypothetical protein
MKLILLIKFLDTMAFRRNNIILYKRIQADFKEFTKTQRLAYDYALELLETKYCKAKGTLQHILGYDLPTELPVSNPKQLDMFSECHSAAN